MADPDRIIGHAIDLVRVASGQGSPRALRNYKRKRKLFFKIVKVAAAMVAAAIVIPVAMITMGLLFGPRAVEGLIAAPLVLLTTWAAILFFAFRKRVTTRTIAAAPIDDLPAQTEEWLERQRPALSAGAQSRVDTILTRLEALGPQVQGLDPQVMEAHELRRLIGEELPQLVHGYRKLPRELQQRPLHDGPSPEHRLLDGLETIDEQLVRLQKRIAQGDLHSLATHHRYLELKYDEDEKLK